MPTSRERRVARAQQARTALDDERLVLAAHLLARPEAAEPRDAARYVVIDATVDGGAPRPVEGTVQLLALHGPDPVLDLYGRAAPPSVAAVGVVAGARARDLHDHGVVGEGRFVHLLRPDGVSVTVVPGARGGPARTLGPTAEVQVGRIADACRRILRLPTAPPPPRTTDVWVDLFLDHLVMACLVEPGLGWSPLVDGYLRQVAGHLDAPLGGWTATPAGLAHLLQAFGRCTTWNDLRNREIEHDAVDADALADIGETGDDDDRLDDGLPGPWFDACTLLWMDVGMYAREVLARPLPRRVVLELLEQLVAPTVLDQIAATVSLALADDATAR